MAAALRGPGQGEGEFKVADTENALVLCPEGWVCGMCACVCVGGVALAIVFGCCTYLLVIQGAADTAIYNFCVSIKP